MAGILVRRWRPWTTGHPRSRGHRRRMPAPHRKLTSGGSGSGPGPPRASGGMSSIVQICRSGVKNRRGSMGSEPGPASVLFVTPWATEPAVVDAPDDPAAVRAGLEPATPRVPETGGRAREKHEGHDRFDLRHARRPSLRQCLRHPSYPVRMTVGPESELPGKAPAVGREVSGEARN